MKKTQKRTNKTARVLGALALTAVLLAGGCAVGYGAGTRWTYKRSEIQATQPSAPDDGNGDNIGNGNNENQGNEFADGDLVHVAEDNGISLMSVRIAPEDYGEYGIDAQADTAYSVTASVNSDALDKAVIGSVAWKDASSSWASGKNIYDYVTLNQVTEYGLDFTFTVKQAIGEPVILKVASCVDSNVNATLQVDYLKEISSFTATLNPSLSANAAGRVYVGDTQNVVQITPRYGVGTVQGNISGYKTTFTVNDFTKNNLKSALNAGAGTNAFTVKSTLTVSGQNFTMPFLSVSFFLGGGGNDAGAKTILNNFFKTYGCGDSAGSMSNTAGVTSIKYEITYSYGSDYSKTLTYTDSTSYGFRNDNLSVIKTISEINLDKNNVVVLPNKDLIVLD